VLEPVAIGVGNARIKLYLSDRIYKRFLVTTEFFDFATTLPPCQLVNAIGDADSAGAALVGAQALLAHTTAPVINAPATVLVTGRCEIVHPSPACPESSRRRPFFGHLFENLGDLRCVILTYAEDDGFADLTADAARTPKGVGCIDV
jgi:hypothetical protein